MLNKRELLIIPITIIFLAFSISILDLKNLFLSTLLFVFIIILMNVLTKKAVSSLLDCEIEIEGWEFQRYWFKKHDYFRKPVPIGLILPLVLKVVSVGFVNWMASLTYEVKGKIYRAAKRHGLYSFSEMSEAQIGAIAACGIGINLILAIIGYLAGFNYFATLNLTFVFFNLIPLADLDGSKIFFGSKVLWTFLVTLTLLGILAAIIII